MNTKKNLSIVMVGFLLLSVFSTLTLVQGGKPSTNLTLTSPNPVGGDPTPGEESSGGWYGSVVASGGGYLFVAAADKEGNVYAYNEKTRALVATMAGSTVAVGGGYVAIGDPTYVPSTISYSVGKVDIYSLSNLKKIVATIIPDGSDASVGTNDFGMSIAISGSQLLIGASGSHGRGWIGDVYLYSVPDFSLLKTLDNHQATGEYGNSFGYKVGFCGSYLVVSSPSDTIGDVAYAGNVCLYSATSPYELINTISNPVVAADPTSPIGRWFGKSIAIVNDKIWINLPETGKTYCFKNDGTQLNSLFCPDTVNDAIFGYSIAANAAYVIVGVPDANVEVTSTTVLSQAGKAYVFDAVTGSHLKTLYSLNPQYQGFFGYSVALISGYFVVGAPNEDVTMKAKSTTTTYYYAGHTYLLTY